MHSQVEMYRLKMIYIIERKTFCVIQPYFTMLNDVEFQLTSQSLLERRGLSLNKLRLPGDDVKEVN